MFVFIKLTFRKQFKKTVNLNVYGGEMLLEKCDGTIDWKNPLPSRVPQQEVPVLPETGATMWKL